MEAGKKGRRVFVAGSLCYQSDLPYNEEDKFLVIMVDSGVNYHKRRKAIRRSWLRYLTDPSLTFLSQEQKNRYFIAASETLLTICSVLVLFVLGEREGVSVEDEQKEHNDIVQLPVVDSYDTIARKTLLFMQYVPSINSLNAQLSVLGG